MGLRRLGDRVADLRVADGLDPREDEPDFPDAQLGHRLRLGRERADLLDLVFLPLRHEPDLHAGANDPVDHARQDDDAAIRVVPGVENQCLQRGVGIALRRGQPVDDRFENLVDPRALLGAREDRVARVEADDFLDLTLRFVGLRARQVDLVDDRDDLEAVLDREVGIRERLGFHALRRVDNQQRALRRGERPGDLVREVDVPRRVDQVQNIRLAVIRVIREPDRMGLDRDAALPLEVHRVEDLRLHLARLQSARQLEESVRERALAVVDMGDDGEVADVTLVHL